MIKAACSAATPRRQQHKQLQPSPSLHVHCLFPFTTAVSLLEGNTLLSKTRPRTSIPNPKGAVNTFAPNKEHRRNSIFYLESCSVMVRNINNSLMWKSVLQKPIHFPAGLWGKRCLTADLKHDEGRGSGSHFRSSRCEASST